MTGRHRIFQRAVWATVLISVFLLLGMVAGCKSDNGNPSSPGGGGGGNPGADEVWIQGNAFSPNSRTVSVGATITWTNKDTIAHTVTSGAPGAPTGDFDSGNVAPGHTYAFHFTTAGTYPYFCNIHHSMTGTIIVQ